MASYEPQVPYAITQFEFDVLVPIQIFGIDVSFTTSAQAMVTTTILVAFFMIFGMRKQAMVPGRLQSAVESVYVFVARTVIKTAGPEAQHTIPFVFTLFVFILFGSLLGLTPVKFTLTSHLVVTLALSLTVFIYVNTLAVRRQGMGFFNIFLPAGTPLYLAPLLIVIEVISYLFRPITLGVRIFANILAGHIMIKLFADFSVMMTEALGAVGVGISLLPVTMMVVLYGFEVMIFLVQAYIFILITSLYIRDALHGH
ncbi:F0F1 ATP synthase subunit A [Pelagibius litoralis]|uniref:ATP synthase subunit a n=1 Tax=Pelagibius litoralis TaxID=374515 RepID=A0A967EYJ4_9PROT|nr:F0F1 ATP synthase subunit A [Pelagibius litoralis]NIA69769.1 F0F1 ATP synthase subunit A [Pelagibius litoralis]